MDFAVFPWRFTFVAREAITFPQGKAANVLRGGFGNVMRRVACDPACPGAPQCKLRHECHYARLFEPTGTGKEGPSGLVDRPRPFVFRAVHLDGLTIPPRGRFHFDVHVFLRDDPPLETFAATVVELGKDGFGPTRGKASLESIWQLNGAREPHVNLSDSTSVPQPVSLRLDEPFQPMKRLRICFLTPTELKSGEKLAERPDFPVLFGRARDRVATLSALYGSGPLPLDFPALGERAANVATTRCELRHVQTERLSSRTGQRHSLGGFVGQAEYEGEIAEFLPILRAAEWTGIGRQTVWGKGEIRCYPSAS
jgi:hypothetical protein